MFRQIQCLLRVILKLKILVLFILTIQQLNAQPINIYDGNQNNFIIKNIEIYEDKSTELSAKEVLDIDSFTLHKSYPINLGLTNSSFWLKIYIQNNSNSNNLIFGVQNPLIDEIELYNISSKQPVLNSILGDNHPFSDRKYNHQHFLFDINLPNKDTSILLVKIKSWEQLIFLPYLSTPIATLESKLTQDLLFGIFFGIMLVLVLYNLFIFFSTKDIGYLYYVVYIFLISSTQAALNGYINRFIFQEQPYLSNISLILFNSLAGIAAVKFIQHFLNTKNQVPTLNKGYIVINFIYIAGIITVLFGELQTSHRLMDMGGALIAFYSLFIAIKLAKRANRSAKYFLAAWSMFLVGVILFVLKNFGVLPSNNLTNHTLTAGVAMEGILLSFALAARINDYKKEKELLQQQAFSALKEKEQLATQQNIILEQNVNERTAELNQTLNNLKETQSQLVDAEKMASLGLLTAGIAHEINNPINFVSSNISPLRQDIDDLIAIISKYEEVDDSSNISAKLKEIDQLKSELDYNFLKDELKTIINSIENGAFRTHEIVRSLRTFSRLDEGDLMFADINEGITSTLTLLKSKLSGIEVITKLEKLPKIECYLGKLNQVFMNLVSNAIDAIDENKAYIKKGIITIETIEEETNIKISISDNGTGIPNEIKEKIFDPFFTTKEVGKGTGLGLSIVYRIINNHKGTIGVTSEKNQGTIFIISIPKNRIN